MTPTIDEMARFVAERLEPDVPIGFIQKADGSRSPRGFFVALKSDSQVTSRVCILAPRDWNFAGAIIDGMRKIGIIVSIYISDEPDDGYPTRLYCNFNGPELSGGHAVNHNPVHAIITAAYRALGGEGAQLKGGNHGR